MLPPQPGTAHGRRSSFLDCNRRGYPPRYRPDKAGNIVPRLGSIVSRHRLDSRTGARIAMVLGTLSAVLWPLPAKSCDNSLWARGGRRWNGSLSRNLADTGLSARGPISVITRRGPPIPGSVVLLIVHSTSAAREALVMIVAPPHYVAECCRWQCGMSTGGCAQDNGTDFADFRGFLAYQPRERAPRRRGSTDRRGYIDRPRCRKLLR